MSLKVSTLKSKLGSAVSALGYLIALVCATQVAAVPLVLLNAYTPLNLPEFAGYVIWVICYLPTAYIALKLSRLRFGTFAIVAATAFAFIIVEGSIAALHQKQERLKAEGK